MLNDVRRLTGNVMVTEQGRTITIVGIQAALIDIDIRNHWSTRKIQIHMFKQMTRSKIVIDTFFALDFEYLIRTIIEDEATYSNKAILKKLLEELRSQTWLKNIYTDHPNPYDFSQLSQIKLTLMPHQLKFLHWCAYVKPRYRLRGILLTAAAGGGKAQPLDAKIKVPGGWSTMGDMRIGSIVSTPDGGTAKVTGVFPQGKKDIYEIEFVDGRKTRACSEHLWEVFKADHRNPDKRWQIINTEEMIDRVHGLSRNRLYVRLPESDLGEDKDFLLSPYLIGCLLGDGCLSQATVMLSTADSEIHDNVRKELDPKMIIKKTSGKYDYRITSDDRVMLRNIFNNELRRLNIKYKLSYEKFVPKEYLVGSRAQRLAMLQGLMDTDGTVNEHHVVSFCSTSEQLAEDVQYLVRSLGGIARISQRIPQYTNSEGDKVDGRLAYQVNIRYKKPSDLFRLTRKKVRCNDDGQYCSDLKLRVKSITLVGKAQAQCISIDSVDHLYITDDFIVTHNTLSSIALALLNNAKQVIIVPPKNAIYDAWESDIVNNVKGNDKIFIADRDNVPVGDEKWFIYHYEALGKLQDDISLFKKGETVIILDESHNLNDVKALRTQLFLTICDTLKPKDIVWSSGTPIKAMGADSIPLIRCLDPLFTPSAEMRFKKIFGKDASKANDMLANRLAIISYKVPKSEFMKDEPIQENIYVTVPNGHDFTLDCIKGKMVRFISERIGYYKERRADDEAFYAKVMAEVKAHYKDDPIALGEFDQYTAHVTTFIKKGFDPMSMAPLAVYCNLFEKDRIIPILSREDARKFKDVKSVIKYTELKIRGEALGRILEGERKQATLAIAEAADLPSLIDSAVKKTIIFTSYVDVVKAIGERLTKLRYKPALVSAETNKNLSGIISTFDKDPKVNPIAATFQSLSTAVRLTMANCIITVNRPYRHHILEQAIARAWRLGQDTTVLVYHLVLDTGDIPNISTRTNDILQWSKEQVDQIMGYTSDIDIDGDIGSITMESFDFEEALDTWVGRGNYLSEDPMVISSEALSYTKTL